MDKRWLVKEIPSQEEVEKLSRAININFCLSAILVQRGIVEFEVAKDFFRPSLSHLHDPFLMKDMDQAIQRLRKAIESQEKILIYGDYDVDGTTAVSLVYSYLKGFNPNIDFYIPDRYKEGYGISSQGIDYAHENGFELIIALDCGIKSIDKIEYANSLGIDF